MSFEDESAGTFAELYGLALERQCFVEQEAEILLFHGFGDAVGLVLGLSALLVLGDDDHAYLAWEWKIDRLVELFGELGPVVFRPDVDI